MLPTSSALLIVEVPMKLSEGGGPWITSFYVAVAPSQGCPFPFKRRTFDKFETGSQNIPEMSFIFHHLLLVSAPGTYEESAGGSMRRISTPGNVMLCK